MSLTEKLQIMEDIWKDLSRDPASLTSPEWHKSVLQDRNDLIQSGQTHFVDWETAKADIRKQL